MKSFLLIVLGLMPLAAQAVEYEIQFENEEVRVSKWKLMPGETVGLHRDEYAAVVFALEGGTIRRLEADGSTTDVVFPKGKATYRPVDSSEALHRSVNVSDTPIEAISVEMKTPSKPKLHK